MNLHLQTEIDDHFTLNFVPNLQKKKKKKKKNAKQCTVLRGGVERLNHFFIIAINF